MLPFIWSAGNRQIYRNRGLVVARGWGEEKMEWLLMGTVFPFGVMKMFESCIVAMVAQPREYAKTTELCAVKSEFCGMRMIFPLWFLFVTVSQEDFHWVGRVSVICRFHETHLGVTSRSCLEKTKQPKQIPKRHMWLVMERNINNSVTLFIQQAIRAPIIC